MRKLVQLIIFAVILGIVGTWLWGRRAMLLENIENMQELAAYDAPAAEASAPQGPANEVQGEEAERYEKLLQRAKEGKEEEGEESAPAENKRVSKAAQARLDQVRSEAAIADEVNRQLSELDDRLKSAEESFARGQLLRKMQRRVGADTAEQAEAAAQRSIFDVVQDQMAMEEAVKNKQAEQGAEGEQSDKVESDAQASVDGSEATVDLNGKKIAAQTPKARAAGSSQQKKAEAPLGSDEAAVQRYRKRQTERSQAAQTTPARMGSSSMNFYDQFQKEIEAAAAENRREQTPTLRLDQEIVVFGEGASPPPEEAGSP